jgi:hypothetical protein
VIAMGDVRTMLERAGRSIAPPEPDLERLVDRRRRKERHRRVASGVVALGLTGGLVAGLSAALPTGEREAVPGATGGERDELPTVGRGQYLYQRVVVVVPDVPGYEAGNAEIETWWGPDGSGRIESSSETPSYGVPRAGSYEAGTFPSEDLGHLSDDPAVLLGQLLDRSGPGGESPQPAVTPGAGLSRDAGMLWRAVVSLVERPNAAPRLRAALVAVAEGIDGVGVDRGVEDPAGRPADVLRFTGWGGELEAYIDPRTRQPLALVERYGADGTWTTIVASYGVVDSTSERATGDRSLIPDAASGD